MSSRRRNPKHIRHKGPCTRNMLWQGNQQANALSVFEKSIQLRIAQKTTISTPREHKHTLSIYLSIYIYIYYIVNMNKIASRNNTSCAELLKQCNVQQCRVGRACLEHCWPGRGLLKSQETAMHTEDDGFPTSLPRP